MNLDEGLSDHLVRQVSQGLLDENGRFKLDRDILRKHYLGLAADERESVSFLLRSAQSWGETKPVFDVKGSHLTLEIPLPQDSPIPQRLNDDPSQCLSAIFPSTHYLYELAVGYNGLAYSERTRGLSLTVHENKIVLGWHFEPDADFEAALRSNYI